MKFIFGMQTNIKVFYKLMLSFWVCPTRHAQSNQIVTYLCNISKETWGGEVDILPANKHESFLQVDNIALGLCSQACPKCPKQ